MATPITHIFLAEQFLKTQGSSFDEAEFVVGTSFPDIRYLGVIQRELTHVAEPSLDDVLHAQSFQAGMLFHSLVDFERELAVNRNHLYDLFSPSQYQTQALKFYEDELVYGQIDSWERIKSFFREVWPGETQFPINVLSIEQWHIILQAYLSSGPSNDTRQALLTELGFSAAAVNEINHLVAEIKMSETISHRVKGYLHWPISS